MKGLHPFLNNILLFTSLLRRAGIPLSPQQSADFACALSLVNIGSRDQVYHTARCLLLDRRENLALFDTLFNRFWRLPPGQEQPPRPKAPLAPRHKKEKPFTIVTYMAAKARQNDPEIDVADKSASYSPAELLQRKAFSQMTPEELETIKRLLQEMAWPVSLRRTRRRVPDPRGEMMHLRRVLRQAAKHGGIPLQLAWQRRKVKQRPLVLMADISGSMERYGRLMLQFFYTVSHSLAQVECFLFGTRLTRITPQLKLKNIDRAVDEAAREVVDWSGGTRIGECLQQFNRAWSRRVLRRGAIVLIVSDGWDRGDVSLLRREMAYLQRRCHRLIWLNPLLGRDDYRPLVEGMAAALPFVDDFLPVHNLQSLAELARHLAALGRYPAMKRAVA